MNQFAANDLARIEAERDFAFQLPLEDIDLTDRRLYEANAIYPYFERFRQEAPVYFHERSFAGPFWSVTRYADIRKIDANHRQFSSEPSVTFVDEDYSTTNNFISMDQPRHDEQRKVVAPVTGPRNLAALEAVIRERAVRIIDGLPDRQAFDWVDRVSIELTTQMLATLFDFPFEERRKLTRWSDITTASVDSGVIESLEQRNQELDECLEFFTELWEARKNNPVGNDLISMLLRGEATRGMPREEFFGNLLLLIVGGNDTTRNSITGGVLALNQYPSEFQKVREDRSLIPAMVAEIIRWQTPVNYMRRTALEDVEFQGQTIRAGDKVAMWYASGNRDPDVFDAPHEFRVGRPNARQHLSFGFGIHRCMGNRLAEMQLRVLWEELIDRVFVIELVGEPVRNRSNLIKGYSSLPVIIQKS
jgi:cytochrome P450